MSDKELSSWSDDKIRRKIDQEQRMYCMALSDGDGADAKRRHELIRRYKSELEAR